MLPRCSQLKVAGPLQTQGSLLGSQVYIHSVFEKVHGTESLEKCWGRQRGPRLKRPLGKNGRRSQVKPENSLKSVLFRFSMWTEPCSWPLCPSGSLGLHSRSFRDSHKGTVPAGGDRQLRYEGTMQSSSLNSSPPS